MRIMLTSLIYVAMQLKEELSASGNARVALHTKDEAFKQKRLTKRGVLYLMTNYVLDKP